MVLYEMQAAFNRYDAEGVIACFEPDVQEVYGALLTLAEAVIFDETSRDAETMRALIRVGGALLYYSEERPINEELPVLQITVNSTQRLASDRVRANATFRYDYSSVIDDEAFSVTTDVDIVRISNEWYIALVPDDSYSVDGEKLEGGLSGGSNHKDDSSSKGGGLIGGGASSTEADAESVINETVPVPVSPDTNTDVYDMVLAQITARQETVVLSGNYAVEEIRFVVKQVKSEHPELFWLSDYTIWTKDSASEIELEMPSEYQNLDQMSAQLDSAVNIIVEQVPHQWSDYEKILFVHDYIVEHTEYDTAGAESNVHGIWGTAYGCLVQHSAVCEGYAKAFQLIMQRLGIECGICDGLGKGALHAWNYVNLNGNYYWIDVTWDDPVLSKQDADDTKSNLRRNYLLINDEMLLRTHSINDDNLFIPKCNSLDENYFVKNKKYMVEYSKEYIQSLIQNEWEAHQVELMFSTKAAYEEAIQKLFDENEIRGIERLKGSGSSIIYYTDDAMYVLTICF